MLELARRLQDRQVTVLVACSRSAHVQALPDNVLLLGRMDDERLAQLYSLADVTVVTGRRETFGMPCAESLCCGTPVAGFQAGGPESISLPDFSRFVPYGDCWSRRWNRCWRWKYSRSPWPQRRLPLIPAGK